MNEAKNNGIPKLPAHITKLAHELVRKCPENDCIIFRNNFLDYEKIMRDYEMILEMVTDVSDSTLFVIKELIVRRQIELIRMYNGNYAIRCYLNEH